MFGIIVWIFFLVVGFGAIGAGFKIFKDARNPLIPSEIRPSAWNAVGAWVLGVFLLFLSL